MKFDPEIHNRRSIRLKGYDYTQPGAYFITLVTYHRDEIFGEVMNAEMKLSALGQIARDEWMRSITIRKEIRLHEDEFVIMPNHLNAIIWLIDPTTVGAHGMRPSNPPSNKIATAHGMRPSDPSSNKITTAHPNRAAGLRSKDEVGVNFKGACHAPQHTIRAAQ